MAASQEDVQPAEEAMSSGSISVEQAQAMIDQALARQAEGFQSQINQMAASLRGNVVTFIPYHGGGHGTDIAETWSQYEQTKAQAADDTAAVPIA